MEPSYWQQAKTELSAADAVLGRLINQYPDISLETRGNAFHTLARSIMGQQISVKAAQSIWNRFIAALPELSPEAVLAAEVEVLRSCGLSGKKVEYVKDLALHFKDGRLQPENWPSQPDEDLIKELSAVKGIGRWTAEMFLIFNLLRPNVLPLDDIGLQRAMELHYNNREKLTKKQMQQIAAPWQPWQSVATWYLWRSLDPVIVAY